MNGDELDALLKSFADSWYRDFTVKLTPGAEKVIGVRTPKLREIAKEISKGDWRGFLECSSRSHEHTLIRGMVIGYAKASMEEKIAYTEKFLPEITDWAINDLFCSSWKLGKKDDREMLWNYCAELVNRHEEFPSRLGAVMMLGQFVDAEHVEKVNDILVLCPRCGYYLDMGIAWTLSVCFVKFPEVTEKYLFDGRLDADVLGMTVRKISDSFRVEKSEKERLKKRFKNEK